VVCPFRCLRRWSSLAAGLRRVAKGRTRGSCKYDDACARVIPGARPVASQSARACGMEKMREKNICTVCLATQERAPRRAPLLLIDLEPHRPAVLARGLF